MNNLRGYITGVLLIFTVGLFSCEPEEIEPTEPQCQCYEQHEQLETVNNGNGLPTLAWVIQYETTPATMPCDSETEYYNTSQTQRWKVICQ